MSYRVLLVGVDDYSIKPLQGCVNDIDSVQRILLGRLQVPADRIRRLASPRPGTSHETTLPERPATLENIRTALVDLAADAKEGDRVFIYYSGHGMRRPFERANGSLFHREALAPVDVHAMPGELQLYDHEVNRLLANIVARTMSVTVVLDCCHSAGATRDPGQPRMTARCLDPHDLGWTRPLRDTGSGTRGDGVTRTIDHCHVVSACLNHELAQEAPSGDRMHGLLSGAFVRALEDIPDAELTSVPWARIWQKMRGSVESQNPWQHLWMAGNPARAVFAGPPVEGDAGLSLRRTDDAYEIDAGTLASVTESALVAVYGERPLELPPIDSPEERAARRGLLRITGAGLSSATAVAEGGEFELPPGARGRMVKAGAPERLRCALVPPDDAIAAALRASPLLEVVEEHRAQVRLERVGDRWLVTDDVHVPTPGLELVALTGDQLARARDVLDHYFHYALPLRMADQVKDLPGALQLTILECPAELGPAAAQEAALKELLPEAPTVGTSVYSIAAGTRVCFRVSNTSDEQLKVTLVNSAASGKVQLLGEQTVDAESSYVFWAGNNLGRPFAMSVPAGKSQGVDRLTAVGTTAMGKSIAYLRLDKKFADILDIRRGTRDIDDDTPQGPPVEKWTASQAIIKTRAQ